MKLRPDFAAPSSSLPFTARLALPAACAIALLATPACESRTRQDASPGPRAAGVTASARPAVAARGSTPASPETPENPGSGANKDAPSNTAAPPNTTAPAPACPTGFTCDYAAWDSAKRPAIDKIFVQKGPHMLHLVAGDTILRSYSVALGWGGAGPKKYEGDGVTPVGTYKITDRLTSPWHTFLGVSYPSLEDQKEFPLRRARGEVPPGVGIGFGIALHGRGKGMKDGEHKKSDWTLGCIALDNPEIDELASVVKRGTKIVITN